LLGAITRENPGIQVVLIANGEINGAHAAPHTAPLGAWQAPPMPSEDDSVPWSEPPTQPDPSGDEDELRKLRAQVQSLTTELQKQAAYVHAPLAQVPAEGGVVETPTGIGTPLEEHSIDVLGIPDDKLENKLIRLGYDTVGKLRAALLDGGLAAAKVKKDWLIDIGMALAGAAPTTSRGANTSALAATSGAAGDVPAGHSDRPWLERLAVAKQKQESLDTLRIDLAEKQAEVDKLYKNNVAVPEQLDDDVIALDESIAITSAHLVSLRWGMGLDPSPERSLDDALSAANLGPWMGKPQPRVLE
jgi:hypothetical protein